MRATNWQLCLHRLNAGAFVISRCFNFNLHAIACACLLICCSNDICQVNSLFESSTWKRNVGV